MRKFRNGNLAIFLSFLLLLPTLIGLVPQKAQAEVFNGQYKDPVCLFNENRPLIVEEGQKFYISDMISYRIYNDYSLFSTPSSVTFTRYIHKEDFTPGFISTDPFVAKVNKTSGLVNTLKPGTCSIIFETSGYGGRMQVPIEVVRAGALGSTTIYKQLNLLAAKLKSVTKENSRLKAVRNYMEAYKKYENELDISGHFDEYGRRNEYPVPMASRLATFLMDFYPLTGVVDTTSASENSFREKYHTVGIEASIKSGAIILTLDKTVKASTVNWLYAFDTNAILGKSGKTLTTDQSKCSIIRVQSTSGLIYFEKVKAKFTVGSKKVYLYPLIYQNGKLVRASIKKGDSFLFSVTENPFFLHLSFAAKGAGSGIAAK